MRYFLLLAIMFTVPAYAAMGPQCPQAASPSSPNFCSTFQAAASCHCTASGLPASMCQDVNEIYDRMIAIFRSVEQACTYQQDTPYQTCLDDWKCFRSGGVDSQGNLCSASGKSC